MEKKTTAKRKKAVKYRNLAVIEQDNKCYWCSTEFNEQNFPTADHVIPRCEGGTTVKENIVAACFQCNCVERGQEQDRWSGIPRPMGVERIMSPEQWVSISIISIKLKLLQSSILTKL
jgi:5-methylcytosine-specific restriction endonuclease McrA